MKIDYVFTYIDTNNKEWLKDKKAFENYEDPTYTNLNSFNNPTFLKYFLRCINKNLGWINNIFMVVPTKEHVPSWVNTKNIEIVEYQDIIPKNRLPLFNTNVVSMYLDNIKGLSEHFIFSEDNNFTLNALKDTDFFDKNNSLPVLSYFLDKKNYNSNNRVENINSFFALGLINNLGITDKSEEYIKLNNVPTPFIKSFNSLIRNFLGDSIKKNLTKFKNNVKSVSSHLYSVAQISSLNMVKSNKNFMDNDYLPLEEICDNILHSNIDFFRVSNKNLKEESIQVVEDAFLKAYPDKCKYEK